MRRRFRIRNERQQILATVIFFFENEINHFVGIVILPTLENHATGMYDNDGNMDEIIADLVPRVGIEDYHDYIELQND